MPHNLSSPSGDTLLASAVDDLPSEPTLTSLTLGPRAVGTLAWTVEQTLDHLVDVFVWYAVQRASAAAMVTRLTPPPPPMPVRTTASRSSRRARRC